MLLKRQPPRGTARAHPKRRVVVLLWGALALPAGAAALAPSPADAHKPPRPGVSVSATPTTVPSGGTTTLTIGVFGAATECELYVFEVATERFPCEAGTVERKLTMPINRSGRPFKYKVYVYAFSPEGTRSKKAKTKVRVESTFRVEMLQRLAGETEYTERELRGMAPLTVEYEIVVSNTEAEVPVKVDNIEDLLVPGCETPPKQHEVKLGEIGVVEATCSYTITEPLRAFTNVASVTGTFFPQPGRTESSFEAQRELEAETE